MCEMSENNDQHSLAEDKGISLSNCKKLSIF